MANSLSYITPRLSGGRVSSCGSPTRVRAKPNLRVPQVRGVDGPYKGQCSKYRRVIPDTSFRQQLWGVVWLWVGGVYRIGREPIKRHLRTIRPQTAEKSKCCINRVSR